MTNTQREKKYQACSHRHGEDWVQEGFTATLEQARDLLARSRALGCATRIYYVGKLVESTSERQSTGDPADYDVQR